MSEFFGFLSFVLGLVIGSFLNSVIFRLKKGESIFFSRSYCIYCNNLLKWYDLVPVISFLILKGKCRYCKKNISLQYPIVELSTGILFFLIFRLTGGDLLAFLYFSVIFSLLIVVFVFDLKYYLIPDEIVYSGVFISFLSAIFKNLSQFLLSGFFTFLFFFIIYFISKEKWIGFGDVKLGLFLGLFLGWPKILIALFFAFFIGALIGAILIFFRKKTLKSEIPFGPFLVSGTFIAIFLENEIFKLTNLIF